MKVVAVTTVSGPYVIARYRCFSEAYAQQQLTLLEYGRTSDDYAWQPSDADVPYARVILSEAPIQRMPARRRIRLILAALERLCPDVLVVCGYGGTGMLTALYWARTRDRPVPVVMLSDSTATDHARTVWKEWIKSQILRQCGSALVAGQRHRQYLQMLGMPEQYMFSGYDVVDNDYFYRETLMLRQQARPQILPNRPYFLASNRFLPKKNLFRLLEAFARYRKTAGADAWDLVLLGDGDLRKKIEAAVASLTLQDAVALPGFKQYFELPLYYAWASCFVHASTTEQWGLVVNEAMAAGLPVVVSNRCGCAPDLVIDGDNGYTFDPTDVAALADRMLAVASDACDREAMGRRSREIITNWSPETFAKGLMNAVAAALDAPRPALPLLDRALLWALVRR